MVLLLLQIGVIVKMRAGEGRKEEFYHRVHELVVQFFFTHDNFTEQKKEIHTKAPRALSQ